jgi:hypothetical protein
MVQSVHKELQTAIYGGQEQKRESGSAAKLQVVKVEDVLAV